MTQPDLSVLDAFFQFKISDLIRVKTQVRAANVYGERFHEPQIGQIIERSIHQCVGGAQMHYAVRMVSGTWKELSTIMQPLMFLEQELEPAPDDPPPQPSTSDHGSAAAG